ncbi:Hint domain-containing protein [Marinovum sp.]|uniref:Hint domain-containing protein n=1 Tax=Marinovum sp. TaxID=2024839 RepID=UPI003A94BE9A
MATYTIVDMNKDPLGPDEIHAGSIIEVTDGDVYIMDPSIGHDVTFNATGNPPAQFDVQFNESNASVVKVNFTGDVIPTISVADGVQLPDVDLMGTNSSGMNLMVGDNVVMGKLFGSSTGADNILVGDGFFTDQDWNTGGGNDTIRFGHDATLKHLKSGAGDDVLYFGNNLTAGDIQTEGGDDNVYVGRNASTAKIDGGNGTDSYRSPESSSNTQNFESTAVVCYAAGTLIKTDRGLRPVEAIQQGERLRTLDHGFQPVIWSRASQHDLRDFRREQHPVLIPAGALGPGLPRRNLIVSPQHRILVGGQGQLQGCFPSEVFVPAKALTILPGVRHMLGRKEITWVHLLCQAHEVIFAEGCASESLLLGPMSLATLGEEERARILGALRNPIASKTPARACLTLTETREFIEANVKSRARVGAA